MRPTAGLTAVITMRPDEQTVEDKRGETTDKNNRADDGEEATPGLMRVPPPGRTDLDGLNERGPLVGHFLLGSRAENWDLVNADLE